MSTPALELPVRSEFIPTGPEKPSSSPPRPSWWSNARLVALTLVMAALKLACAALTVGSGDVNTFHHFAVSLQTMDICALYHQTLLFNHTPLVAGYLTVLASFADHSSREFAFFLRLPGILAELALALFFVAQRRQAPLAACPGWALALFIASPVSFLVTGFHGNFDAVMVCFLVLAAFMCVRGQPSASALFLALSLQVKVAPLIVLPVFFVYWYRHGVLRRFGFFLALLCVVGWAEPLTRDPVVFVRNVFGYSSYWGSWGVTYWLKHTFWEPFLSPGIVAASLPQRLITQALKLTIIAGITALAWTRRPFTGEKVFPVLALAWSLFFFLTPGAGVQYLVWPAPFVLLYRPRWYLGMTVCCSLFAYLFYRIICNSWLPYYGESTAEQYWLWSPWMLWAWVGCSEGAWRFWREHRTPGGGFFGFLADKAA